jgi:hypothetical protein
VSKSFGYVFNAFNSSQFVQVNGDEVKPSVSFRPTSFSQKQFSGFADAFLLAGQKSFNGSPKFVGGASLDFNENDQIAFESHQVNFAQFRSDILGDNSVTAPTEKKGCLPFGSPSPFVC